MYCGMTTHTPAVKGPSRMLIITETDKRSGEMGQEDSSLGKASLFKHKNDCLNAQNPGKSQVQQMHL